MALLKEPKNIDLNVKSKEWSERELKDFRVIMKRMKSKKRVQKISKLKKVKKTN